VQAVSAVKVHDGVGGVVTLDAASYAADALSEPARLGHALALADC